MYLPEEPAFRVLCQLLDESGMLTHPLSVLQTLNPCKEGCLGELEQTNLKALTGMWVSACVCMCQMVMCTSCQNQDLLVFYVTRL